MAVPAVMGPVWLDAATPGTLVDDVALPETQLGDVLLSGIALRNSSLQQPQLITLGIFIQLKSKHVRNLYSLDLAKSNMSVR